MNQVVQYKAIIVACTSIVMIFGFVLSTFSIFILYDQSNIFEILPSDLYRSGVYLIAFSGILLIIICLLSYFGAYLMDRFLIIVVCGFEIIIAILLLIAAILILVFDKSMESSVSISLMESSLQNYYNRTTLISDAWDETQIRMRCCGVSDNSWSLYRNSYWSKTVNINYVFNETIGDSSPFYLMVPQSCCYRTIDGQTGWPSDNVLNVDQCQNFQYGPPRFDNGAQNDAIYYRGCYNATRSYIRNYSGYLAGLSLFGLAIVMIGVGGTCHFLNGDTIDKSD